MITDFTLTAIVPILPAVNTAFVVFSALVVSGLTLLGVTGSARDRRTLLRFLARQTPSFLVIAVLSFTALGLMRRMSRPIPVATTVVSGAWPVFQGSSQRLGFLPGSHAPVADEIAWRAKHGGGYAFYASPGIAGREVFAIACNGDSGSIMSWDVASGKLQRFIEPPGFRATFSSPVIQGNLLVCGEGLHHTKNARVICVDLNSSEVAWTFATNSHVECTPWIQGNRVFVAAGDDGIYALRLDPRVGSRERVIWHAPGELYPDAETCLAADDRYVYVGLGEGGNALVVLDAGTGQEEFRIEMPFPVYAPPALVGDQLFLGMGVGNFVDFTTNANGQLACINIAKQRVDWTIPMQGTVLGAIVVDEAQVIFGCSDGTLTITNLEGEILRQWNSRAAILGSPAVTKDFIYVVNDEGRLFTLDRNSLEPVAEVVVGDTGRFMSSPVVAHGRVLLGTEQHGFVAVGEGSTTEQAPGRFQSFAASPVTHVRNQTLPMYGRQLWNVQLDHALYRGPTCTASIDVAGQTLAVALCSKNPTSTGHQQRVFCFDSQGELPPSLRWSQTAAHEASLGVVVCEDEILLRRTTRAGDEFVCLDRDGRQESARKLRRDTRVARADEEVYLVDNSGHLVAASVNGDTLWRSEIGSTAGPLLVNGPLLIIALDKPWGVAALLRRTGQVLWFQRLDAPIKRAFQHGQHLVVLTERRRVSLHSFVDGQVERSWAVDPLAEILSLDDHLLIAKAGKLILRPLPGTEASWKALGDLTSASSPSCEPQHEFLFAFLNGVLRLEEASLVRYSPQGERLGTWAKLAPEQIPVVAAAVDEDRIYLLNSTGQLTCLRGAES